MRLHLYFLHVLGQHLKHARLRQGKAELPLDREPSLRSPPLLKRTQWEVREMPGHSPLSVLSVGLDLCRLPLILPSLIERESLPPLLPQPPLPPHPRLSPITLLVGC